MLQFGMNKSPDKRNSLVSNHLNPIVLLQRIENMPQMAHTNKSVAKSKASAGLRDTRSFEPVLPSDESDDDCIIVDDAPPTGQCSTAEVRGFKTNFL